jgi:hypothetical protein
LVAVVVLVGVFVVVVSLFVARVVGVSARKVWDIAIGVYARPEQFVFLVEKLLLSVGGGVDSIASVRVVGVVLAFVRFLPLLPPTCWRRRSRIEESAKARLVGCGRVKNIDQT